MARQPLGGLERLIVRCFTITLLRHNTFGRTPLDEWSSLPRDLYLTIHNTYKRQTSMPSAGFEHAIPVSERPQTQALDRTATGIGRGYVYAYIIHSAHSLCHVRRKLTTTGEILKYRFVPTRKEGWKVFHAVLKGNSSSQCQFLLPIRLCSSFPTKSMLTPLQWYTQFVSLSYVTWETARRLLLFFMHVHAACVWCAVRR
jgi:hypothetical protein